MGMMDWVNGGDDDADTDSRGGDSDPLDDDFGGFNGDFDGSGFDGDFDNGFDGDLDDAGFDGGLDDAGFDGDDGTLAEMQDRLAEVETEVATISSSIDTVREENKQIGETVDELDDTIRKLLDIYEMVTRGINPFVDDAQAVDNFEGSGSFGLFSPSGDSDESGDDLDPSVANADAESFFGDDFGEPGSDSGAGFDDEDFLDEDDGLLDEDDDTPGDESDDGTVSTFEELKREYEENPDEWDDDDGDTDGQLDVGLDADEDGDVGEEFGVTDDFEVGDGEALNADEGALDDDGARSDPAGHFDERAEVAETDPTMFIAPDAPYLRSLPSSYLAETLVLEWMRYLVRVGGVVGATDALDRYREFGWITERVRSNLVDYVGCVAVDTPARPTVLGVDHHRRSLVFVSRLAGDAVESSLLTELATDGGSHDGIWG
ncbi:MAG: flagella accessory protein C [Halobacteriota archaeon]